MKSSKEEAPLVPLKKVEETTEVETPHGRVHSDLYTIPGEGNHFVSLKPSSAEISRFHPDPELGARLRLDVVTSFVAKSITLNYKKPQEFEIGPEKITLESSGFEY